MVQYKARTALNPTKDFDGFLSFLGGSIVTKFTRKQISEKINKLKRKFNVRFSKEEEEEYPNLKFANSIDARIFHYSKLFWGPNNRTHSPLPHLNIVISDDDEEEHATGVDNNEQQSDEEEDDNGEETHTDDEHMADASMDNEQQGEEEDGTETEANDTNDAAEELCYLKDAVETMLSYGLTDHQKKPQVDNIVKLGAEKRRELSREWKALCREEAKLIMNKFKLAAKIAKAIDDKF